MPWRDAYAKLTATANEAFIGDTIAGEKGHWANEIPGLIDRRFQSGLFAGDNPEYFNDSVTRSDVSTTPTIYDTDIFSSITTAPNDAQPLRLEAGVTTALLLQTSFTPSHASPTPSLPRWDTGASELDRDDNTSTTQNTIQSNVSRSSVPKRSQRPKLRARSKSDNLTSHSKEVNTSESHGFPNNRRNHNIIERRYRTRLNQSILDVADRLPSGRRGFRGSTRCSPLEQDGSSEETALRGKHKGKIDMLQEVASYIDFLHMQIGCLEQELACPGLQRDTWGEWKETQELRITPSS